MTNPRSNNSNLFNRVLQRARHPATLIVGVGVIGLGVVGYVGGKIYLEQNLPSIIENQLSGILERKVVVGKIENLSLNHLDLLSVSIPATATDPDYLTIKNIKVDYNILNLLLFRPLLAEIDIEDMDVYAQQEKDGKWINLNLEKFQQQNQQEKNKQLPIDVDVSLKLNSTQIALLPYGKTNPLNIDIKGTARLTQIDTTQIQCDLNTLISKAKLNLKADTIIETGKSKVELFIQSLYLPELTALIPNSPVTFNQGEVNVNLNLQLPSFQDVKQTIAQGNANLSQIELKIAQLKKPLFLTAKTNFQGQKMIVEEGKASLGDLVAQVGGEIDWQKGFDININVTPFSLSNLINTLQVSLPVKIDGKMEAKVDIVGDLLNPIIKGSLNNSQNLVVDKLQLRQFNTEFTASLDEVVLNNLLIKPVAGGEIRAKGLAKTLLSKSIAANTPIDIKEIPLELNLNALLPVEAIASPYYIFPKQIELGTLTANGNITGTINQPQGFLQWLLPRQARKVNNISGKGQVIFAADNIYFKNTQIQALGGNINLDGNANLQSRKWQTLLNATAIPLTPFISQLPISQKQIDLSRPVTLNNANFQLTGNLDALDVNNINGKGNLNLNLDGGRLNLETQLNSGNLQVNSKINRLQVSNFLPSLPVPVNLTDTQLIASAPLQQLLTFSQKPNLNNVQVSLNSRVLVDEGKVAATANLRNNQWNSNINARQINLISITEGILPLAQREKLNLSNLNAQVNLSGNLQSLFQENSSATIQANSIQIDVGQQFLNATGEVILTNLNKKPDIANLSLNIDARSQLGNIPVAEIISQLPSDIRSQLPLEGDIIPHKIDMKGFGTFKGNLVGKNLLSAPIPANNLALTGNLRLENFSFTNRVFDPILAGPVEIAPGKKIAINLQGKNDAIAASLEPCTTPRCRLPYLPVSLDFRQGKNNKAIVVTGYRQGDRFISNVQSLPLDILQIAPGYRYGIPGVIGGKLTADLDINLFNFATNGKLEVNKPGIGNIQAKKLAAEFSYDADKRFAQLGSATFVFGRSKYDLDANINLQSGEINANLNIPQAYVQDIFNTLQWSNIEDVSKLFQLVQYGTVAQIPKISVGNQKAPLSQQVNLLGEIDQKIKEMAAKILAGGNIPQLDIEGRYRGNVNIAGTLKNPQVDFKVQGDNWDWRLQPELLNIVSPVGLVWEKDQPIPIHQLLVQGSLRDGSFKIEPVSVKIAEMAFSFSGELKQDNKTQRIKNANFVVDNLSMDLIKTFVNIPADVNGTINIKGNLAGTVNKPELQGEVAFVNPIFNGQALNQNFQGQFQYSNALFQFNTIEPSFIQVKASVPFPIKPQINDQAKVDVKIEKEAFSLLGILTQGQVQWIEGEGEVNLSAGGRLDLNKAEKITDLFASGKITLENAVINSPTFEEQVKVNAEIDINNQLIEVKDIKVNLDDSVIEVQGNLPILQEDSNPNNTLSINIEEANININNLYNGNIAGQINITGSGLRPVIGGEVNLSNGQVSIPPAQSRSQTASFAEQFQANTPRRITAQIFSPSLQNFQVTLNELQISDFSLFLFGFSGNITLNGNLDNIKNLRPEGTIQLNRGDVSFFNTQFFLAPRYNSTITFIPEEGLTNPNLDIRMETALSDFNKQTGKGELSLANESRDNLIRNNRPDTIRVTLAIDGLASQIIPSLGKDARDVCQIRSLDAPLVPEEIAIAPDEAARLSECIRINAFASQSDLSLLNSSAIKLTSSPPLSENEIAQKLGGQLLGLAESLQGANQSDLLEMGLLQFVLGPIQRDVLYRIDKASNAIGRTIGLSNLRLYPLVETDVPLDERSLVRFSYDYTFNEGRVTYELRF